MQFFDTFVYVKIKLSRSVVTTSGLLSSIYRVLRLPRNLDQLFAISSAAVHLYMSRLRLMPAYAAYTV